MKTTIEITHHKGIVTAFIEENIPAGTMQFELQAPNQMLITHTITKPGFEGKGVGKALVQAGIDYAKEHELTIIPICSFAKAYIERVGLISPTVRT